MIFVNYEKDIKRVNQKQTIQWLKEKRQKNKQWSTLHYI